MNLLVKLPEPSKSTQKLTVAPPMGLWSIAHNAPGRKQFKIIDLHLQSVMYPDQDPFDLLVDELRRREWETVGVSVQFSIQHAAYERAAEIVWNHHPGRIVAGGFHAAAVEKPWGVDEVARGAGETFFDARQIEYVPAMVLAEKMEPYWKLGAPHDLQSITGGWIPIEFSRGCDRACGFCGVRSYWGTPQRRTKGQVAEYLGSLRYYGIQEVFIEDDNALADSEFFEHVLRQFRKTGIYWSTPNGVPARGLRDFIFDLSKSNCWRVSLPFETGSRDTAKLMRLGQKWMEFEEARDLVKDIRDEGILTCGFFIIGYPGESLDDMRETLAYANALPLDQRNIYIATPYPGTPLYDLCQERGYLTVQPPELYTDLLYTKGLIKTEEWGPEDVEKLKREDREAAMRRKGLL